MLGNRIILAAYDLYANLIGSRKATPFFISTNPNVLFVNTITQAGYAIVHQQTYSGFKKENVIKP